MCEAQKRTRAARVYAVGWSTAPWECMSFLLNHFSAGTEYSSYIKGGYYTDSILRFRLTYPRNFPEHPPRVHFVTDVFHPLVSQRDGSFNLTPRFRPWRPKDHHIFDVLHFLKAAFKKHQLDHLEESDCLNKDAFRYRDATVSFAALARQTSALSNSKSALYDRENGNKGRPGLVFSETPEDELRRLRESLDLQEWTIQDTTL